MSAKLRCAIYTRKSSEEGLEQNFNSLHAQRESCAAYILSQAGEGWSEIPTVYDDGGYSGGSMDRPGLKALLTDIGKGLIESALRARTRVGCQMPVHHSRAPHLCVVGYHLHNYRKQHGKSSATQTQ